MSHKECCDAGTKTGPISFPGTYEPNTPWKLYNHLIGGIPEDIEVTDVCLGSHWCYVEAACGMGVSMLVRGGASRTYRQDLCGMKLREVAELSKSWSFPEATIGVAALNAWYAQPDKLDALGAVYEEPVELPDGSIRKLDAFETYREEYAGKKVVVVGHFPHIERVAEVADLTVLERSCTSPLDVPDPACEYVVPTADFLFVTGTTFTNKTAPRLLDLAKNARVIMVGPSVVMSPFLFRLGVEALAGSCVADPEKVRTAVKIGAGRLFGEALRMLMVKAPR